MATHPPEGAATEDQRRRRTMLLVLLAVLVVILILIFSVCNGDGGDDAATPATTQPPATTSEVTATTAVSVTSSATQATTATTATNAATDTTVDPFAAFNVTEPTDVRVEWTCDEPSVLGNGAFGTGCMTQSRDAVFVQGVFLMIIDYTLDTEGSPVGMAVGASSYGPNCFWTPVDSTPKESPVVDGKANHSGVMTGDGRCEGVQWAWESTWDVETHTLLTTGVLEPVA